MRIMESECVDCGKQCLREACPKHNVAHYYCDRCGAEDTLYKTDDGELCADCILCSLPKVEGSY